MGYLSPSTDCDDEKDAVISDLEHRDDRKAATESKPTTYEDIYGEKHSSLGLN